MYEFVEKSVNEEVSFRALKDAIHELMEIKMSERGYPDWDKDVPQPHVAAVHRLCRAELVSDIGRILGEIPRV